MLFNKRIEYSIQIILYMSKLNNQAYINAGEIAMKLKLPKEFLSKILQTLTHFKIVNSQKGKNGGFKLIKPTSEIKLSELINAFEDESFIYSCILGMKKVCTGCNCPMYENWERTKIEILNTYLNEITLNKENVIYNF